MKRLRIKSLGPWLLLTLLLGISALCILGFKNTAGLLTSQSAAQRWQGDNETTFAQISCFTSAADSITQEEIYSFRTAMLTKLKEASFEVSADTSLIHDAWCGFGQVDAAKGQRKGKLSVTAVGGSYFDFHPIKLISGNYLNPDDLMEDRVLLDRESAWLLFGGEELAGMSFEINGQPFYVAGVIDREDDRFSKRAYDGGMGIYMHYEAYEKLNENAAISCYELVMAEPVKGFVYSAVTEKFPIGTGEIVDNSYRFEPERLLKLLKDGSSRSMHLGQAVYPYWENAARGAENSCLWFIVAAMIFAALPVALALYFAIKALVTGKRRLEDEYIPAAKEKLTESWRVKQRKAWEKKHMK